MITLHYTIPLPPITKKNSQQILKTKDGRAFIAPSKAFTEYQSKAGWYLKPRPVKPIDTAVTVKCVFYMPTKRAVDLSNLEEAAHDMLVKYGILADDNYRVIASHDGSRVLYDKENPRTEITITKFEEENEDGNVSLFD